MSVEAYDLAGSIFGFGNWNFSDGSCGHLVQSPCTLPRLVDKEKFPPSESSQTPLSPLAGSPPPPTHFLFLLKFSIDSIIAPKGQAANPFPIFAQKY